jgi:hypothetical protein
MTKLLMWLMLSSTMILAQAPQPSLPLSTPTAPASSAAPASPGLTPQDQTTLEKIKDVLNNVPSAPSPTVAPVTAAPPATFVGAGALYNPSGTPRVTGWATYAKLVDAKSQSYFFTTEDAFVSKLNGSYTTTVSGRVGMATLIKALGPVQVFGIVDGGGATAGTVSGAAASGGGIAMIKVKSDYYLMLGYRALLLQGQAGTPKLYEIGFGKAW